MPKQGNNICIKINKISDYPFYSMEYSGDDYFDLYIQHGANSIEEYCRFINEQLLHNQAAEIIYPSFGCSAFTAANTNGERLLARNMDCDTAIPMLLRKKKKMSISFLSLVNMSFLDWNKQTLDSLKQNSLLIPATAYSPCDGINAYGVAVAILTDAKAVYSKQNDKITLFDMTFPRLLLDYAKNIDDAIMLAEKYNLFADVAPLHFMVADSSGKSVIIEYVNGKMVTIRNKYNYQVVSNFTIYGNPDLDGFGKERYENIHNILKKQDGIISEKDALKLLQENVISGDEQWSAVYNLTKRKLFLTLADNPKKIYQFDYAM